MVVGGIALAVRPSTLFIWLELVRLGYGSCVWYGTLARAGMVLGICRPRKVVELVGEGKACMQYSQMALCNYEAMTH